MYEKLGKAKGSNVAMRAIIAFLVPIGVFIGVLYAGERLLQGRFERKMLTLVSFLLAVCVTLLYLQSGLFAARLKKNTVIKGKFHGENSR